MKEKIYYIMDPMCGWCYSFSPVIGQAYENFKEKLDFIVVPAGMLTDKEVIHANKEFIDFLKTANIRITETSGQSFGEGYKKNILGNPDYTFDSLPGAMAITLIQKLRPENTLDYIKKFYHAFYFEGKNTNDLQLYADLAALYGITPQEFLTALREPELEQITRRGFQLANELGAELYPSVIGVKDDIPQLLSQAYVPYEQLREQIITWQQGKN